MKNLIFSFITFISFSSTAMQQAVTKPTAAKKSEEPSAIQKILKETAERVKQDTATQFALYIPLTEDPQKPGSLRTTINKDQQKQLVNLLVALDFLTMPVPTNTADNPVNFLLTTLITELSKLPISHEDIVHYLHDAILKSAQDKDFVSSLAKKLRFQQGPLLLENMTGQPVIYQFVSHFLGTEPTMNMTMTGTLGTGAGKLPADAWALLNSNFAMGGPNTWGNTTLLVLKSGISEKPAVFIINKLGLYSIIKDDKGSLAIELQDPEKIVLIQKTIEQRIKALEALAKPTDQEKIALMQSQQLLMMLSNEPLIAQA